MMRHGRIHPILREPAEIRFVREVSDSLVKEDIAMRAALDDMGKRLDVIHTQINGITARKGTAY